MRRKTSRVGSEVEYYGKMDHIWLGARTVAGQRRYVNRLKLMRGLCPVTRAWEVLEIGCGDGEFTRRLATLGCRVVATDVTPAVVERGRRQLRSRNVKFKVEDAESLSFKAKSFDLVCGISILHHADLEEAVRECYRVLKKGGMIFFTEPNLANPQIWLGLHVGWLRRKMEFSPQETALLRWQVEASLKKVGFRQVVVKNYDFLHPDTPAFLMKTMEWVGGWCEKMPLVKEISGTLFVWAMK